MEHAGKPLRVGLLLNSLHLPAWQYAMLERLQGASYARLALIVVNNAREEPREGRLAGLWRERRTLLYRAYQKFERRRFRPIPDAFAVHDARGLLADIPILPVTPRRTQYSDYVQEEDIARIRDYDLDVFLRLGFRILRGKILQAAKYGVWSFHHGDNQVNRGGPAGFWEVFEHQPVTGSMLQILTEDLDNGVVLARSYAATDKQSVTLNRNNFYWKTLALFPRKLEELHHLGAEEFFRRVHDANNHLQFYSHRLYTMPANREFAKLFVRHVARYARMKVQDVVSTQQWTLFFDLRDGVSSSLWRFRALHPPQDRYWADPHIVYHEGRYFIFIEEFEYVKKKGHIAVMIMDQQEAYTPPVPVLELPSHVSYPCVFAWQGRYYMAPESGANGAIDLYHCRTFPYEWEWCGTLMENVKAVDATLFCHQQRWWLFTNMREQAGASSCDELFLFSADHPLSGQWRPHPHNPVVSDVRRARPAGQLFTYHGALYRPAQDCSQRYGYAVRIHQVEQLNDAEYREREVSVIEPRWDPRVKAVHTFSHAQRLTMVDGVFMRSFFSWKGQNKRPPERGTASPR